MNNNPSRDTSLLKQTNVIYSYKCTIGDCALRSNCKYIGLTTTSLSRRITMHLQNGGPKTHTETNHEQRLTRKQIIENITCSPDFDWLITSVTILRYAVMRTNMSGITWNVFVLTIVFLLKYSRKCLMRDEALNGHVHLEKVRQVTENY